MAKKYLIHTLKAIPSTINCDNLTVKIINGKVTGKLKIEVKAKEPLARDEIPATNVKILDNAADVNNTKVKN